MKKKAAAKPQAKPAAKPTAAKTARPAASNGQQKPKEQPPIADLDFYRKKLEEIRDNLQRAVRAKKEEAVPEGEVGDEGDVAMRSLARDLVFEVSDNEHRLLEEVEAALRRMEKGTYGYCEANGERIAVARLKAIPYARYCINCQARFERP